MKTLKVLLLALIVSAVLSVAAQAGNRHGNSGSQVSSAPARSSTSSFRSSPGGNFSGGRMIAPSQRFSSVGVRSMPTTFRQHYINSTGNASVGRRQFTPGTLSRGNGLARFDNTRDFRTNPGNHFAQIQNARQNRLAGNQNLRGDHPGQFQNRGANRFNSNGSSNLPGRGNHVFARRDADWHRDWDRHSDHWWHGHRCRFVNNSWFIFDLGFIPWYGFPYDYYASDYYLNPYAYDSGVYEGDANYYGQGTYDSSNQYPETTVAAAQEQLARQGYYRGQIDGIFGPETQRAIMRYQRDHGLRITGYLTMDTRESLGLEQVASY
jgi:putative peptidoglycan binding protein